MSSQRPTPNSLEATSATRAVVSHVPGPVRVALLLWIVGESVWTALLGLHLPRTYVAEHWDLAWVGLDVAQVTSLLSVLVLGVKRSALTALFAPVAGTLLLVDAWFDMTTARRGDLGWSVLTVGLEVPAAGALFMLGVRVVRQVSRSN